MHKAWSSIDEVLFCFSRSSIKFQGHTALKIDKFFRVIHQISRSQGLKYQRFELNLSKITRPVAAIKSLRFALLIRPLGANFSEILIVILIFSFKKMRLKVSFAKRQPFCLGINVLIHIWWWNDAQSLMLIRRGALLFSRASVKFQGHTDKKNRQFWPKLSVSGL